MSKEFLKRASENLAKLVANEFNSTIRSLKAAGNADSLRQKKFEVFQQTLSRTLKGQPTWSDIFLHDKSHYRVLSALEPYDGVLKPTVERDSLDDVFTSKQPRVGYVKAAPIGSAFAFAVRVPILGDSGEVEYVLSAIIGVDKTQAILLGDNTVPNEYVRAVVDGSGVLAARSRDPEKFVGRLASTTLRELLHSKADQGLSITNTLESVPAYTAFNRIPGFEWYVAIAVPVEILEAGSSSTFRTLSGVALILLCLSAAATVFLARGLRNSIRAAGDGAAALSRGQSPDLNTSAIKEIEYLRNSLLSASNLLRAREKTKSEFLANMSHELRTPLGIVIGMVDSLASDTLDHEERQSLTEIVKRNSKHLLRLIDDILDVAKIEANKLVVERVDFSLRDLIASVAEDFTPRVRERSIHLRTFIDPASPDLINCDPVRVRQVLVNLLGNATKFTQQGSIDLRLNPSSDERITITIADTGVGISEAHQDLLFTDFSQADSSHTRRFGGTGLGLSLSRKLARLLDGDVRLVQSEINKGATFEFSFLAQQVKSELRNSDSEKESVQTAFPRAGKILLAEDSPDNVILIKTYLRNMPIEIEIASNGLEAFELAAKNSYDLILMDIQMPMLDGYEATQKLREAGISTPIIAITAHALAEHRTSAINAGFNEYLTKPILRQTLLKIIEQHLS